MENDIILDRIKDTIIDSMDCIIMLDLKSERYHIVKSNDEWKKRIPYNGSFKELFYSLFTSVKTGEDKDIAYSRFSNEDLFKLERYQGKMDIYINGVRKSYGTTVIKMSEAESLLSIYEVGDTFFRDKLELEKVDAIQENYLFSMMADLAMDACLNPNTTEISASRQDYIDIKYSDWRMMISNMFMESDRDYFLRMTSPEHIINTLEENHNFEFELQMLNMQGKYIWVRLTFTRLRGFGRDYPRFVYTVKDIQQDMERLLRQNSIIKAVEEQNEKLKSAEKERTKFFSNMSHEIRTPINAILGMNEVILRESTEDNIRSYAKDIKGSSRFLLSIVNDILDVSKIQAGKMEIVPVEYNLDEMIKDINTLIKSRIGDKDLEYIVDVNPKIPKILYGDEIRITQVIINLLTNAVKYTPRGSVKLLVEPDRADDGQFAIKVSVIDTGIGIKPEDMEKLFAAFERIDTEKNRRIEGTGLGISIVTGLLEQMNSKLEVKSVYGEGSEFSFVLPQKVVRKLSYEEKDVTSLDVSDKSVLVVDDTGVNLKVARALLKPYKMTVDLANSGKMCLEKIEDKHYDLIFLDHMMPEMDGIETLKEIRAKGEAFEKVPIVALTANNYSDARKEYLAYGFNDFLEKPITTNNLERIIKTYLGKK